MPKVKINCVICNKEKTIYPSDIKHAKNGKICCSVKCRREWVARLNSLSMGGNGILRPKKEKDAEYYSKNLESHREKSKEYYWKNRDKILAQKKAKDREAKEIVVKAYGGKCECCGESIIEFLTIDHINGDGHLHRRKVGKGRKIYQDLINLGFPKDNYRLLCFNCNITRGFYGYCPHHPDNKQDISHVPFNPGRKRTVQAFS
ncbi:MAG TPA: hypothetical protein ENI07_15635 [Desulfobacterales bacterium]|nr:hypothetical protein [Desulfobacterales bacterium]